METITRRTALLSSAALAPLLASGQDSDSFERITWAGLSPGVIGNAARLVVPVSNLLSTHAEPSPQSWAAVYGALSAMLIQFEESGLNRQISRNWRRMLQDRESLDKTAVASACAQLGLTVPAAIWRRAETLLTTPGAITEWRSHLAAMVAFTEHQALGGVHSALDPHRYWPPHRLLPVQQPLTLDNLNPWWAVGGFGLVLIGAAAIALGTVEIAAIGVGVAAVGVGYLVAAVA